MKFLVLAHKTPFPPHRGYQVRPYQIMKALKRRGHRVHLIAFGTDDDRRVAPPGLADICDVVRILPFDTRLAKARAMAALASGRCLSEAYFSTRAFSGAVDAALAGGIDGVVAYSSSMAQHVPAAYRSRAFLEMADVDSAKWVAFAARHGAPLSWVYRTEARRLSAIENRRIGEFGCTCLSTEREIALLGDLPLGARRKLVAITNGVDEAFFRPRPLDESMLGLLDAKSRPALQAGRSILLFTGAMDYLPNAEAAIHFAQRVLPAVRERVPDAEFYVVGSNPTREVLALGDLPGVTVTGTVADVRPYFAAAKAYVLPLTLARGIQNKALEAMACGLPMVSYPDPANAVGARHGDTLLIAADAGAFAAHVVGVLEGRVDAAGIGKRARAFVESRYGWPPLMDRLVDICEQLVTHGRFDGAHP